MRSPTQGTIRGTVLDPSGAAISGSTVEIENPVSHYNRSAQTDSQGHFEFDNVPFNNYHTTAAAQGFQTGTRRRHVRSTVPIDLNYSLKIGAATTSVTVEGVRRICSKPIPPRASMWIARCSISCRSKVNLPR